MLWMRAFICRGASLACEKAHKWSEAKKKIASEASQVWPEGRKKAGKPADFVLIPPIHDTRFWYSWSDWSDRCTSTINNLEEYLRAREIY